MLQREDIEVNIQDSYGWTASTKVCMYGQADCVKLLFQHKDINVTLKDTRGRTYKDFFDL